MCGTKTGFFKGIRRIRGFLAWESGLRNTFASLHPGRVIVECGCCFPNRMEDKSRLSQKPLGGRPPVPFFFNYI